jgi:hypothetical protein
VKPRQLRIYVAGPYTAPDPASVEANTKRAIDAGLQILKKGHTPYIPHLTHYVDLRVRERGEHLTWDQYIAWDMQWLAMCDALVLLGNSKGANLELEKARGLGLQIFLSVDEIPVIPDVA